MVFSVSSVPSVVNKSLPTILIIKSLNIILTQQSPRLHLNDLKNLITRVGQAVLMANRDIDRLVGLNHLHHILQGHLSYATHNHPVFSAMLMALQGKAGPGRDCNAFDEEAVSGIEPLIGPPWTIDAFVQKVFFPVLCFEPGDDLFDLLNTILGGDKHSISRLNHDCVLKTDTRNQS